jgi:peptide/nickel transport system permease protein
LVQGDLGKSYHNETAVIELIITAFLPTIILVSVSLSFAVIIGGLIGTISAVYENTYIDSFARVLAVVGVSVPIFWAAIMFIIFFSVFLNWLPVAGFGTVSHLVLPALALSGQSMAFVARLFRSNLIEEKRQDYVRTARSKGISEKRIWIHHIFRNSLLSIVTLIGIRFGTLIGGAVIVENVFAWPGLGSLILTAVNSRDYPVILGSVIWIAILVMIVNLIVDILYTVLDPKIGYK